MNESKQKMSWYEAIRTVLENSKNPLHYTVITNQILDKEYRTWEGTSKPEATVNHTLNDNPETFENKGKGIYSLKSIATDDKDKNEVITENAIIIESFGVHWNESDVDWKNNPDLWGRRQNSNTPCNFKEQIGIYVLYDRDRIVYVGKAVNESIGNRLFDHKKNKDGKWDNFSWFGFRQASEFGGVSLSKEKISNLSFVKLANAIESILIEITNPPMNKKRGDDHLSKKEFVQCEPDLIKQFHNSGE